MAVTPAEVRVILPPSTQLTDAQIDEAILSAGCVIEQLELKCPGKFSAACLRQIELYLAAHFCAVSEFTLNTVKEKDPCCGGEATYGFNLGTGLEGTPYGQAANTLAAGCLTDLNKIPAVMFSIGTHGNDSVCA